MKSKTHKKGKHIGSIKVGTKGQIVIPKEIRDMFGINPGDTLVILADAQKGIAIERMSVFNKVADTILSGKAKDIYPDHSEEDSLNFAKEIKKLNGDEEDKE